MNIESVYKQYFKDVFLYLRSLSADAGTAEELAQETFMKALKSLDSFDGSRDIRAWLLRSQGIHIIRSAAESVFMQIRVRQKGMQTVKADMGWLICLGMGWICTEM